MFRCFPFHLLGEIVYAAGGAFAHEGVVVVDVDFVAGFLLLW